MKRKQQFTLYTLLTPNLAFNIMIFQTINVKFYKLVYSPLQIPQFGGKPKLSQKRVSLSSLPFPSLPSTPFSPARHYVTGEREVENRPNLVQHNPYPTQWIKMIISNNPGNSSLLLKNRVRLHTIHQLMDPFPDPMYAGHIVHQAAHCCHLSTMVAPSQIRVGIYIS